MGIYSSTLKDIVDIKDGVKVTIPNDVTNGGRAPLLLQATGLIKVDEAEGQAPTVSDITENRKNLDISGLDTSQIARVLSGVDVSVINSDVAVGAGFNPAPNAIFLKPADDHTCPHVNIIAAGKKDEKDRTYQKVVDTYQTEDTVKTIEETPKGSSMPVWEAFGRK